MSFATAKEKHYHQPIWLFEYDLPKDQSLFVGHKAGVYKIDLAVLQSENFTDIGDSFWTETDLYNRSKFSITSVTVVNNSDAVSTVYTERSLTDLSANDESFYFDPIHNIIYISYSSFYPWYLFSTRLGAAFGFSNNGYHSGTRYYPPQIQSISPITQTRDISFYGVQENNPITVTLKNDETNNNLDSMVNTDIYNKEARIKLGFIDDGAATDFETMYTGQIENIPSVSYDAVEVQLNSKRSFLTAGLPRNRCTTDDFPNIEQELIDTPKPLGFGYVEAAPIFCVNGSASTGPYEFIVADTANWELSSTFTPNIYINGALIASTSYSPTTGIIKLSSNSWNPDSGDEVACSFVGHITSTGQVIQNGMHIIREMLKEFVSIDYSSATYDTTEWAAYESNAANMAISIREEIPLNDVISTIADSLDGMFYETRDGRFRFRAVDTSAAPSTSIPFGNLLNPPVAKYNADEWASKVTVKFNKNHFADRWQHTTTENEAAIYNKYGSYRTKEFETVIKYTTDAKMLATDRLDYFSDIKATFEVTAPLKHLDVEVLDTVNVEINRVGGQWMGNIKTEVLSAGINPDANTINLKLRYISEAT
jgi:hypothetical protein